MNKTLHAKLGRLQRAAAVVGVIALVICLWGGSHDPAQFFISWLFGWLCWLGLGLGCFAVAMIYYLTGGRWGDVSRRFLEAGYLTLPVMAVFFIPLLFGAKHLYPWDQPAVVAADPALQHRHAYMNIQAFVFRLIFIFAVWIVMTLLLRKWSLAQDQTIDVAPTRRLRALSGPGVIIYVMTTTLAFIDWLMSLESDWYSTMFVVIICIGQILMAYALIILLLYWLKDEAPLAEVLKPFHFHHLGNLLLAFVMFWTYVCFGQFLIIWSGNLPREIVWYLHRISGSWKGLVFFLLLFNFLVPFFFLLFRASKRHASVLAGLAACVFIAQIANIFWMIAPTFHPAGIHVSWQDFAAFFGIGGIWLTAFAAFLKGAPLLPKNDPRIQLSPAHG